MLDKRLTSGKFWIVVIMIVISIVLVMFVASLMDVIVHKEFMEYDTGMLIVFLLIPATVISVLFNIFFAARMKTKRKGDRGKNGKR